NVPLGETPMTARELVLESLAHRRPAVLFYGGVSTQRLLPYANPAEVKAETRRLTTESGALATQKRISPKYSNAKCALV
ncbi:MAG: hypothetical protein ACOYM2_15290, partial [Rectinemataceae bacterium]